MKKDAIIGMIRINMGILAAVLMAFAVTSGALATTAVYTSTVSDFSSQLSTVGRDASKTVDSSGLAFTVPTAINSIADLPNHNEEASNMWLTDNGSGHVAYIVFDLGAVEPVNILYVWNYAEQNSDLPQFAVPNQNILDAEGANAVSIYYSASAITPSLSGVNGTVTGNGTLVESTNFAQETFASVPSNVDTAYNATPQEIDFPQNISARYIELAINSNFPGASSDLVGLSEVRFAFVPEPASLSLLGIGGVMLLKRRRQA